jgi:ribosomal protein S27AE
MSLRLRFVRTSDGQMLQEALVRGVYARLGEDELVNFHHASVGPLEVTASDQGYRVGSVDVTTYAVLDFGDIALHCTVLRLRRDDSAVSGACPRCGTLLRPAAMGAAYRTIATDRMECPQCEAQVLNLHNAAETLGRAGGQSAGWVPVVSTMVCPQCGRAMTPATLSVGATAVAVEACAPCDRVLVEPEDRRALEVAAKRAEP